VIPAATIEEAFKMYDSIAAPIEKSNRESIKKNLREKAIAGGVRIRFADETPKVIL